MTSEMNEGKRFELNQKVLGMCQGFSGDAKKWKDFTFFFTLSLILQ